MTERYAAYLSLSNTYLMPRSSCYVISFMRSLLDRFWLVSAIRPPFSIAKKPRARTGKHRPARGLRVCRVEKVNAVLAVYGKCIIHLCFRAGKGLEIRAFRPCFFYALLYFWPPIPASSGVSGWLRRQGSTACSYWLGKRVRRNRRTASAGPASLQHIVLCPQGAQRSGNSGTKANRRWPAHRRMAPHRPAEGSCRRHNWRKGRG